VVTQVPSGELKPVEQSLIEHVCRGDWLDLLVGDEEVDEVTMRSWGDWRTCSATVIRDILRGLRAAQPDPQGLRLRGAKITGLLDLENLTTDVRLELKDCYLNEGVCARGARLASLTLAGCQLEHPTKPPLDADRLTCGGLDLRGVRIIGHADVGAVRLSRARIGGSLECDGASLYNDSGPALNANGLHVDQGIFLRREFTATGSGDDGAVSVIGARIDGNFDCEGAKLHNSSGPALVADGLQIGGAFLRAGFTATGSSSDAAVILVGARIGGSLHCEGAELHNGSGPALNASSLQVGQVMLLSDTFTAIGGGMDVVSLAGAQVGGVLLFAPARLEHVAADSHRLVVDGLTYAGVPLLVSVRAWLQMLRHGTPYYAAQPYQQLAAGCRALGDERQVREVLIAQRNDQLARTRIGWPERLWGWITRVTLGYGYKPWRALLFLAGLVALSCVLAVVLGSHGALAQTDKTATPGRSCTVIQDVSVGLDLNLPIGQSVAREKCDLTTNSASTTAAFLTAVGWVLRLLAWAFAALFIAGFTSAVRKT